MLIYLLLPAVIQATSGFKALKLLETKFVDLIISDIQMPDGDGFEMLKELKNLRRILR